MTIRHYQMHHVSVIVDDTATSLKFYCGVLGLEQAQRPELAFPGAWLQIGPQQIHLMELDNPDAITGRPKHGGRDRHVALNIVDLDSVRQALEENGVEFTLSISGRKALFCRDPDGNAVEIIERGFEVL